MEKRQIDCGCRIIGGVIARRMRKLAWNKHLTNQIGQTRAQSSRIVATLSLRTVSSTQTYERPIPTPPRATPTGDARCVETKKSCTNNCNIVIDISGAGSHQPVNQLMV
jgi:hypothetical protein